MKVAGSFVRTAMGFTKVALGAAALSGLIGATGRAQAQAPYLLPYTIKILAGGGTAPTVGASCTSPTTGVVGTAYDTMGNGCPVDSPAVVAGAASDLHDVVVDQQGNVYFLDNGSSTGAVRRIDAHTGIITVFVGSYVIQTNLCAATQDKYGDGCPASDGKANAGTNASGNTGNLGKARGIGITKNGDVFVADYSNSVAHKVAAATGLMTMVAGSLASSTKLTSNGGAKGFSGDGGIAFNPLATPTPQGAALNADRGITADVYGDVFIADSTNQVVRLVYEGGPAAATLITLTNPGKTPTLGYIYTVVGSDANAPSAATAGAIGDGGLASGAELSTPEDVEVDLNGNLFIGDIGNNKVRVVYAGGAAVANLIALTNSGATAQVGFIYTVVGGGSTTYTAPAQVLATSIAIGNPRKLTLDSRGNIFIADNGNNIIWFVDIATGYMRPIAGTFSSTTPAPAALCTAKTDALGDNCPATAAALYANSAMGVTIDSQENLYIGDSGDQRLRKVFTNQTFPTTVAGTTVAQTLEVHFAAGDTPAALNPYLITGSSDFSVASATCNAPNADKTEDCLLLINFTPSKAGAEIGTLTVASTLNGSASFGLSGVGVAASVALDPGTTASFASALSSPQGIAQDAAGNTYVADTGHNKVLKFASAGNPVVIAGTGASGYTGDGLAATAATLNGPKAVAVTRSGLIYIADTGNNAIRLVNPLTGVITTVAGAATAVCNDANDTLGDGCIGTAATFNKPAGLAADASGNVYVADTGNSLIRELTASGYVLPYAGGTAKCSAGDTYGNGCPATSLTSGSAVFANPTGLAMDSAGNLFVADTGNNEIREINGGTYNVTAIAGTGQAGASGNGGTATGAQLNAPTGVAVDAADNVYIADTGNSVIRVVNASGIINSTAGTLSAPGTGTLPGSAFAVQLSSPGGVVANGLGALVVLDSGNNRAFTDNRGSVTYNFGRTNLGFASPTLQIQQTSTGSASTTLNSPLFTPTPALPFALAPTTGSTGCSTGALTPGASCFLIASFTPSATQLGNFSATYTESTSTVTNTPTPFVSLSGVGAVLTTTTSLTVVTTPATGSPQYSIPFVVTTTVTPASCNTAAPGCFPTGTVTFFVAGTQVGLPIAVSATGTASQTISGLNVGTYAVTAVYSGDLYYASSSAPSLAVTVTRGSTTTAVALSPSTGLQFSAFNMTAQVTAATSNVPTGTFTFYAGTVNIGTAPVNSRTGAGPLLDTLAATQPLIPTHYQNYGLNAGTYAITAVYSGDTNYAPSTSAVATLTIQADPATFAVSLAPSTAGTAQGSTASVVATVTANNTFNGTVAFTCTNLPANAICTFGPPTSLAFVAVPGVPTEQQINITLWTDVTNGVTQTTSQFATPHRPFAPRRGESALAALLGWPVLLSSFAGILAFRRRLRSNPRTLRLLTLAGLFGILAGGSIVMSGCSGSSFSTAITPVGTYTVNFVATGPGSTMVSTPITFIVAQGATGQL